MNVGDYAAWYAAIVATGALALEVRRWRESGARLALSVMPEAKTVGGIGPPDESTYIAVTVANRGSAPTTITTLALLEFKNPWKCFWRLSSRSAVVPNPAYSGGFPLPHTLPPGAIWMGLIRQDESLSTWIESRKLHVAVYATHADKPDIIRVIKRPVPNNSKLKIAGQK